MPSLHANPGNTRDDRLLLVPRQRQIGGEQMGEAQSWRLLTE
jgi:hypothetical protein